MNTYKVSAKIIVRVTDKVYGANTAEEAEKRFLVVFGDTILDTQGVEMELIYTDVSLEAGQA